MLRGRLYSYADDGKNLQGCKRVPVKRSKLSSGTGQSRERRQRDSRQGLSQRSPTSSCAAADPRQLRARTGAHAVGFCRDRVRAAYDCGLCLLYAQLSVACKPRQVMRLRDYRRKDRMHAKTPSHQLLFTRAVSIRMLEHNE